MSLERPRPLFAYDEMPRLEPYRQGSFDGLCGLYVIVNGIHLALEPHGGLTKAQSRALFKSGMRFLEEHDCGDIVRNGLHTGDWFSLARSMFVELRKRLGIDLRRGRKAFRKLPSDIVDAITEIEQSIERGHPVAIELKKAWNHYTIVSHVTADGWLLFDSYGYTAVKKSSLGMKDSAARHILGRRAIFFVPRSENCAPDREGDKSIKSAANDRTSPHRAATKMGA